MRAPLIVAGMHQSGISLVASFLTVLGVDMGESAPPNDVGLNGFLEDLDFLELHRRMFEAATPAKNDGYRKWGYTEDEVFDKSRLSGFQEQARKLIEARSETAGPWGWKDPRATLLLEFWYDVINDFGFGPARYVLLYRSPWDVSESMQRSGVDVFMEHPEYGFSIWKYYNRELLRFFRRHRDTSALVCIDALIRQPELFVSLMNKRFGFALRDANLDEVYEAGLLSTINGSDPLISLLAATEPGSIDLLAELDREADLSSAGLWEVTEYRTCRLRPDGGDPLPDLSVVIPCHDDGRFLIEAVASVERMDFEYCELIIVNDGSQDPHTLGILDMLRKAGHYVIDQQNLEVSEARNRGIREARGRYILPLDADNRLRPGFAMAAVETLDQLQEVGVVYSDCLEFGMRSGLRNPPEFDLSNLLRGNFIDTCAVFRKSAWEDAGGYDSALLAWEDWEFWINVAGRGWRFFRLPQVGFEYRVRPGSKVTLTEQPETHEQIVHHVVAKHSGMFQNHLAKGLVLWHRDVRGRECTLASALEEARFLDRAASQSRANAEELHREMSALHSSVEACHRKVKSQRANLEDRKREIQSLQFDVETKHALISEQRGKLDDLGDHITDLRREISALHSQIGACHRQAKSQRANLEDRKREIQTLQSDREAKHQMILEQRARLDDLGGQITDLRREKAEINEIAERLLLQLGRHQDMIAEIQTTLAWRFTNACGNLGRRLAPEESLRRQLCNRISSVFKAKT